MTKKIWLPVLLVVLLLSGVFVVGNIVARNTVWIDDGPTLTNP